MLHKNQESCVHMRALLHALFLETITPAHALIRKLLRLEHFFRVCCDVTCMSGTTWCCLHAPLLQLPECATYTGALLTQAHHAPFNVCTDLASDGCRTVEGYITAVFVYLSVPWVVQYRDRPQVHHFFLVYVGNRLCLSSILLVKRRPTTFLY